MYGIGIVHLLLVTAIVAVFAFFAYRSLRRAFGRPGTTTKAVEAFSVSTGRVAIVVGLIALAVLNKFSSSEQVGAGRIAPWFGGVGLICVGLLAVMETRWPRQSGSVRRATLQRRRARDCIGTWYFALAASGISATGIAVVAWWLLSGPVAGGGRQIGFTAVTIENVKTTPAVSVPIFDGKELLVAMTLLLAMTVAAGFAIRQVLNRPVLADIQPEVDAALRRISAQRLVRLVAACWLVIANVISEALGDQLSWLQVQAQQTGVIGGFGELLEILGFVCAALVLVCYLTGPVRLPNKVSRTLSVPTS